MTGTAASEGSFRRTRGGRVECRLSAGPRWARRVFYGYGASEKEALRVARARRRLAEADTPDLDAIVTGPLDGWLDWWLDVELADRVADRTLAATTRSSYRLKAARQIRPHLGHVHVRKLGAPQVRAWLAVSSFRLRDVR